MTGKYFKTFSEIIQKYIKLKINMQQQTVNAMIWNVLECFHHFVTCPHLS